MAAQLPSELLPAILISVISFLITFSVTQGLVSYLPKKGFVVEDFHKQGKPKIPTLGGIAILTGILVSEGFLYLLIGDVRIISIVLVTLAAGGIGFVDDFRALPGVCKPVLLILAALPILILGTYDFNLSLPFFGTVRLSIIYPIMILIAIPVTANTVNTIDVFNGIVSGHVAIATIPVIIALLLNSNYTVALAAIPLLASSLGFYLFHRYPSKIFLGDVGTLALGAMYGAIVVVGEVEVVGIIAILPAILNSFFFLSSVKRFIEHRKLKARPVLLTNDYKLSASKDPTAPMTLVRIILAEGPLTEQEITSIIIKLTIFSAILATITALVT